MDLDFCKETKFFEILEYFTLGLASISFLGLCYALKDYSNRSSQKKHLTANFILIIIISEIINSIGKLISILNRFLPKQYDIMGNEHLTSLHWIIFINIQAGLSILSDNLTLLSSFFISLKIYDMMLLKDYLFQTTFKNKRSIYFIIIISLIITAISVTFNIIMNSYPEINDRECKIWFWVKSPISVCLYAYYITMVIEIFIMSIKSINVLREQEQNIRQIEQNFKEGESDDNSLFSSKIRKLKMKVKKFPIATACIWIIVSIDRFPDDICHLINIYRKEEFHYKGILRFVKYGLVTFHNIIGCTRGLIYVIVNFYNDSKLFKCCDNKYKKSVLNEEGNVRNGSSLPDSIEQM